MRISDWSSDVCSSDLGGAGELVDHLAFGHGDLADLDGEAEFLRHELHRHLAEADLSGEGMVAPVAALRRVAERQKEALVTAREVLQAQVAPGREAQRSEEHTSELQSLMRISYAVFCLKKKKQQNIHDRDNRSSRPGNKTHKHNTNKAKKEN